jgi:peptidyl-prolyl cis-trans isomerase C
MKFGRFLLIPACLAVVISSCTSTDDKIVAQLGDYEITVGKIKQEYLAISKHARPRLETVEEKEAFVMDVVAKEVVRRAAEEAGFGQLPQVEAARERALQTAAWQAFYQDEIKSKVGVTEPEMRAVYEKQGLGYDLAWILLRSRAMALEALREIRAGKDFGAAASVYSMDPSFTRDGDIGIRLMGSMPANVESEIMAMTPGQISDVLDYDDYYVIIKLLGIEEREQPDFEDSKVALESTIMTRKIGDLQRELAAAYREKYHVSYNDDVIGLIAERTRAANPTEDTPRGQLPRFSDDELQLVASSHDGGEWTVGKYLDRMSYMRDFGRPSYGTDSECVRSVLRDYMTGELWVMEAVELGYGDRPEVVQAADRAREEAMVTAFHDSLVKDVTVDEDDLRKFYDENREQMLSDQTYNIGIIVTETKEEAQAIYDELQRGADFAALAREKSIDPRTRDRGGEIGETLVGSRLQQFPDVYDALLEMEPGDYAGPMLPPPGWGPEGWMVMKLIREEEPRQLAFEEVKAGFWERVLQMEQDRKFGTWLSERMEDVSASIKPDELASIDFSKLRES